MESIEDKLRQAWRQQQRFHNVRGLSRFLIWLVFMIVLDFLIDWGIFFQIRMSVRLGFLLVAINVAVLGWVLWNDWIKNLKPYDPLLVALDVEAKHPELSSLLVSYTQLQELPKSQPDVSVELIEAMREQALLQTRPLDFREIIDFGQIKNLLVVAIVVLAGFGVASYSKQEHVKALFQRLAGIDVSYPTQTQVVQVSGDLTIRVGDPAQVQVKVAGVVPAQGRIFTRPAGGKGVWKPLPLKKNPNQGTFQREIKEIVKDMEYYVRVGDDQSDVHRILVVAAPRIVSTKVALSYPAYMGKTAEERDQLNLEVPVGTKIKWQLTSDASVKRMLIKTDRTSENGKEPETIEAKIDNTGRQLTFDLEAVQGFKYTFVWTERDSGQDFEYDDVQHSIRVVTDSIPEVELVRPGSDGLATVQKKFRLVARAQDDYGLAQAWLVYTLDDNSEENRLPIRDFNGLPREEFDFSWELNKSIENLEPGVRITFAVEVADRNPAGQRNRRSAARHFTVVDQERYLEWHRAELAAQRDAIQRVRDREISSSTVVKQLKEQETKEP